MELVKIQKSNYRKFKKLYKEAFPKEERKPLYFMRKQEKLGKCERFCLMEDGEFLGLMIFVPYEDLVLIDYFAISGEKRGCGFGSRALKLAEEKFDKERILLEIEEIDANAENAKQREKRKQFYLRNGFSECFVKAKVAGCRFELLSMHGAVKYSEYENLLKHVFSSKVFSFINPSQL